MLLAVLAVVVLALGAAVAFVLYGPRSTPEGQPPLAKVESIEVVKQAFNRDVESVRVLALLSPT